MCVDNEKNKCCHYLTFKQRCMNCGANKGIFLLHVLLMYSIVFYSSFHKIDVGEFKFNAQCVSPRLVSCRSGRRVASPCSGSTLCPVCPPWLPSPSERPLHPCTHAPTSPLQVTACSAQVTNTHNGAGLRMAHTQHYGLDVNCSEVMTKLVMKSFHFRICWSHGNILKWYCL